MRPLLLSAQVPSGAILRVFTSNATFAKRTYRLQILIVRELNDAHIFLEQCQPALIDVRRDSKPAVQSQSAVTTSRSRDEPSSRSAPMLS
jgi:hypothetical protein